MPFISINLSASITKAQKDEIKTRLGKLIEIIPSKSEKGLMVDISDDHALYYAGQEMENAAFIDVRLYKDSPFDEKGEFFKQTCLMLGEIAGVDPQSVYCNIFELQNWGSRGVFR